MKDSVRQPDGTKEEKRFEKKMGLKRFEKMIHLTIKHLGAFFFGGLT